MTPDTHGRTDPPDPPVTAALPYPGRYKHMRRVAVGDWECLDCGCLVIDRDVHDRWHATVEPSDVPRLRVMKHG